MQNKSFIEKDFLKLRGVVKHITERTVIKRKTNKDLIKRVLTIETFDQQVLFPELRNNKLKLLEQELIAEGSQVEIEFSFEGSEKNGKRYNNIYLHSIKRI